MSKPYKKGYSLEHSVQNILEEMAVPVIRFARSRPADLFFKVGDERFIAECKNVTRRDEQSIYIPSDEVDKLRKVAGLFDANPILIFSFYRQRPQVAELERLVSTGKSLRLDKGKGVPLRSYVEVRQRGSVLQDGLFEK